MLLRLFLLFVFFPSFFYGTETKAVPLTLEHAVTQQERAWGLMGRRELPTNHGMLFHFPATRAHKFWMFNCFIDLSVAFLDEKLRIIQIEDLKSYPEKMDPYRPVNSLNDLAYYPPKDPILIFFQKNEVTAPPSTRYALEMSWNWFKENGIKSGSVLSWDQDSGVISTSHNQDKFDESIK